jgi:hypothetical protein
MGQPYSKRVNQDRAQHHARALFFQVIRVHIAQHENATFIQGVVLTQRFFGFVLASVFLGLCSGCTSQQLYATGQSYQRNQCLHVPDQGEREKCLSNTNMTYEDYKRETGSDNK